MRRSFLSSLPLICVCAAATAACVELPQPAASSGGEDDGTSAGADGAGEGDRGGGDGEAAEDYRVLGFMDAAAPGSARVVPFGYGMTHAAVAQEECPFSGPEGQAVCEDPRCQDPESPGCEDAVREYCEKHPEDGACQLGPGGDDGGHEPPPGGDDGGHEPPPGGDGGHEPGPGEGGGWVCDTDPSWPPCDECGGRDVDPQACEERMRSYCTENPQDETCRELFMGGSADESYTPSAWYMKIYSVELSAHEDCSDPILVGRTDDPEYLNFATAPELVSPGDVPDGVYPCVIVTASDQIRWVVDDEGPCQGEHLQDIYSEYEDYPDPDKQPEPGEDYPNPDKDEGPQPGEEGPPPGERPPGGGDGVEQVLRIYMSVGGSDFGDSFEPPGIKLHAPQETGPHVEASRFVTRVGGVIGYYADRGDGQSGCEMNQPEFTFDTVYKDSESTTE